MEKKLSNINFFICSTYIDLKSYRDELIKKIQSHSGVINAQEFFGARDNKPIETCLEEVSQSKVFVMFLAFRFGSVDAESGKYFVEREYEKAKELGLPKFVYLMDESTPFLPKYVAKDQEAKDLENFKNQLRIDHTVVSFTTSEDLSNKVSQDLLKELPKHGFRIGKLKKSRRDKSVISTLNSFLTLPRVYYGREIEITIKLDKYYRANENECEAYSFRYGSTAKRAFAFSDSKIGSEIKSLSYIFADGENAEELISLPSDEDLTLLVRTIQGVLRWKEPIYEIQDITNLVDENYPYTIQLTPSFGVPRKAKIQTGSTSHSELVCGLEFVERKEMK